MNATGSFTTGSLVMIAASTGALGALVSLRLPIFIFVLMVAIGAFIVLSGALLWGLPASQALWLDGAGVVAAQIGYVLGVVAQALGGSQRRHGTTDE